MAHRPRKAIENRGSLIRFLAPLGALFAVALACSNQARGFRAASNPKP